MSLCKQKDILVTDIARHRRLEMNEKDDSSSKRAAVPGEPSAQPSRPSRRLRKRPLIWTLAAAVILAPAAAHFFGGRVSAARRTTAALSVPTALVQQGPISELIRLTGQTSARNFASITMASLRGGRVDLSLTQLVAPGALVKKGDVVAALDTTTQKENLTTAEDNLDQSQADMKRRQAQEQVDMETLRENLRSLKAAMDQAAQDYRANEVKTPIDQEILKLVVEQTAAQYKQAQASEELEKTSIAADMAGYEIAYKRLQRTHDRIQSDLDRFTFIAPMDGLAVVQTFNRGGTNDVQYQIGDSINPGQSLLKIVDLASMQLETMANQAEVRDLRIGMPATVELDAFQGVSFPGSIYSIGAMASGDEYGSFYVRTVPVKVKIQGVDPRLIPDLSGEAAVTINHKQNALTIPSEALHIDGAKNYVYVETATGFVRQGVELGVQSPTKVEVVSGLTAGQRVALQTPDTGTR
jgi:multidrug resistance efflux pump